MASTFPQGFGYVGAALVSTAWLIIGQSFTVSAARKNAKIDYPQMYASTAQQKESKEALIFNCAQRAHQNTLENLPIVWISTIVSGLQYPVLSASACALWVVSRIFYTRGYITGDPKKRVGPVYMVGTFSLLGSFLAASYVSGTWVYQNITA
ncbi:membrane-associated proteins in eicosanoid and glutathione metabolism [Coprinopsis marcescibilis]|uniref:Membrane-associated proteins in eicosanoid and glutathione metabolism n=1 Tax=Coprinopsis marcescibilis TaxID=230819 RepID=A0A5C3LDF6_COPMA|nr:membrane-associated proteins in eicosanoid and glutathione metabolism [Coprinopsis marcescibilis]